MVSAGDQMSTEVPDPGVRHLAAERPNAPRVIDEFSINMRRRDKHRPLAAIQHEGRSVI